MDHIPLSRTTSASTARTQETAATEKSAVSKPRLSLSLKPNRQKEFPGLQWDKEYTTETLKNGRCLLIEYILTTTPEGEKKLDERTKEISDLELLRKVYKNGRPPDVSLRLFHIQNWPEACKFVTHKFRLHEVGDAFTDRFGFQDWVMERNMKRRGGKPLLQAKSFKLSVDPRRQVSKCAVGLDYLKKYRCMHEGDTDAGNPSMVTGLMGYDQNDNPSHVHNVYAQRISMYFQYHHSEPGTLSQVGVISPYRSANHPQMYDNGNTIIIMDTSSSHSIKDTLIPARGEFESRWRRLPITLPGAHEHADVETDEYYVGQCMRVITQDVFTAIYQGWDELLDAAWEHLSILEDKIYEQPADESRAPELWKNQAKWLILEKLMYYHIDCVAELKKYLPELDGDVSDQEQWLKDTQSQLQRISDLIAEDLTKRTSNLSELMYKSVSVRDSRESLRLGASMWRLSWITFIFLPANCLLAAFGMNVKQLENMPDISWMFIWAVPFFMAILVMWYGLKYWFAASRDVVSPRRGVYEGLFSELAEQRPEIWTRQGPRDYVVPATTTSSWKWAIMVWWTRNVDIGTTSRTTSVETEPIGLWTRFQRALLRRWTPQIRLADSCATEKMSEDLESASTGQALPKAMVEAADPAIVVGAGRTWRTISEDWALHQEEADLAGPEDEGTRQSGILMEEGSDETKLQQINEVDQGSEDAGRHSSSGQHLEPPKTFDWIPSDARTE